MNNTFGTITQLSIINTMKKKNTYVLALVVFMRRDIKIQQNSSEC